MRPRIFVSNGFGTAWVAFRKELTNDGKAFNASGNIPSSDDTVEGGLTVSVRRISLSQPRVLLTDKEWRTWIGTGRAAENLNGTSCRLQWFWLD